MKFVSDKISIAPVNKEGGTVAVRLPVYHRAAAGIFDGTIVHGVHSPGASELILSTVKPDQWGDLWRLEATLKDEPGAVLSLVNALVDNDVNILIQESVSECLPNGEFVHHAFMVIDLAQHASANDLDGQARADPELARFLPTDLIWKLEEKARPFLTKREDLSGWRLSVSRMDFFYRHAGAESPSERLRMDLSKELHLPLEMVATALGREPAGEGVAVHITSDTEEKYIRLRFLDPGRYYLVLRCNHLERIGAIRQFMRVLQDRDGNLVDTYNRLKSVDEDAVWYALVEFRKGLTQPKLEALVSEFEDIDLLGSIDLLDSFGHGPKMTTPKRSAPATVKKLEASLAPAIDHVVTESRLGVAYPDERDPSGSWKYEETSVFMAMPFNESYEQFYDDFVLNTVVEHGLSPVRVDRSPQGSKRESVVEQIERLIASSRFLIADLSGWNVNVVYELGLAEGISKPVIRLCEDRFLDTAPFDLRNYRMLTYSPYKPRDLKKSLSAALRDMISATETLGS